MGFVTVVVVCVLLASEVGASKSMFLKPPSLLLRTILNTVFWPERSSSTSHAQILFMLYVVCMQKNVYVHNTVSMHGFSGGVQGQSPPSLPTILGTRAQRDYPMCGYAEGREFSHTLLESTHAYLHNQA